MREQELGRRLVECKHYEWMAGMLIRDSLGEPYRIKWVNGDCLECDEDDQLRYPYTGLIPDITDPATVGCVLHLARKAYDFPGLYVVYDHHALAWLVWGLPGVAHPARAKFGLVGRGRTEAEALVVALEAAP